MMDHLQKAIIGDSMQRASRKKNKNTDTLPKEIIAEATHLAKTLAPDVAQRLLAYLLADAVLDRLRKMIEQHGESDFPTDLIQ